MKQSKLKTTEGNSKIKRKQSKKTKGILGHQFCFSELMPENCDTK